VNGSNTKWIVLVCSISSRQTCADSKLHRVNSDHLQFYPSVSYQTCLSTYGHGCVVETVVFIVKSLILKPIVLGLLVIHSADYGHSSSTLEPSTAVKSITQHQQLGC